MPKAQETTIYVRKYAKNIVEDADSTNKNQAATFHGISPAAVDSAYYLMGRPEKCAPSYVRIKKHGKQPIKTFKDGELLVELLSSEEAPSLIMEALGELFDTIKRQKMQITSLASLVETQQTVLKSLYKQIDALRLELKVSHSEKRRVVLEKAREALVVYGD